MLTNKTAIITGASSGIGQATAARFLAEGASVLATGRSLEGLQAIESPDPDRLSLHVADLTDSTAPVEIVAAAVERFGHLDILVNAAGIIGTGSIEETTDEAWDEMMDINLRAPFRLMREAAHALIERRGTIVNVSSVTGLRAFPGVLTYCVSKAGLDHLTRSAAMDLAPLGVRVNAVNPGVVLTQLHRRAGMDEENYDAFLEHSKTTHPLGRTGVPKDIVESILFLASEGSSWITGETIAIDGGRHLTCAR